MRIWWYLLCKQKFCVLFLVGKKNVKNLQKKKSDFVDYSVPAAWRKRLTNGSENEIEIKLSWLNLVNICWLLMTQNYHNKIKILTLLFYIVIYPSYSLCFCCELNRVISRSPLKDAAQRFSLVNYFQTQRDSTSRFIGVVFSFFWVFN